MVKTKGAKGIHVISGPTPNHKPNYRLLCIKQFIKLYTLISSLNRQFTYTLTFPFTCRLLQV